MQINNGGVPTRGEIAMRRIQSQIGMAAAVLVLALGLTGQAMGGNLIVNGGFEDGPETYPAFSQGWTRTPDSANGEYTFVTTGEEGITPYQGSYFATFSNYASQGASGISQTVATTAGQTYDLNFWFTNSASSDQSNQLMVTWDGTTLINMTDFASFNAVWQNFNFVVTGTGSDTVVFSGFQDIGYNGLDNVSLNSVPEPSSLVAAMTAVPICVAYWWGRRRCRGR
jgi:hypothetical protein